MTTAFQYDLLISLRFLPGVRMNVVLFVGHNKKTSQDNPPGFYGISPASHGFHIQLKYEMS